VDYPELTGDYSFGKELVIKLGDISLPVQD
jgi:hypothetical protein